MKQRRRPFLSSRSKVWRKQDTK